MTAGRGARLLVGLDDTDVEGSPGTNQLARRLADRLAEHGLAVEVVLRHQLLRDPRVPCTTQNGSASLIARAGSASALAPAALDRLWSALAADVRAFAPPGSDPGLALWAGAGRAPRPIEAFGGQAQQALVDLEHALALARADGVRLEGLGGTRGGAIGALAAIGLASTGDDGRVVHRPGWPWPDPLAGWVEIEHVLARGVDEVRAWMTGATLREGPIDLGKHLRPAWRGGRVVLFAEPDGSGAWRALKLD